jgi:alkylation response protein AidB-like acyl-CoA dehydrogenase
MTALDTPAVSVAAQAGLPEELAGALRTHAADRSRDVDADRADVRDTLRWLAEQDLLTAGAPANAGGGLARSVAVIAALAGGCMATAFSTWAHRATVEYLAASGNAVLRDTLLPRLARAELTGSTAMATAFQDVLGLREVDVVARPEGGDVVLDGRIGWASNLFDGGIVVLPARLEDGRRLVVAVSLDAAGISVAPRPPLLALQATRSSSFGLEAVRVPAEHLVAEDFSAFLAQVRPTFLLLQAAFCVGVAEAALDSSRDRLTGTNAELAGDQRDLEGRHDEVTDHLLRQARAVGTNAAPRPVDTTRVRLDAARLAVEAVAHEARVRGGAGYVASSPTARRLREVAFLPIQSPTEAQLRWEMSRSA